MVKEIRFLDVIRTEVCNRIVACWQALIPLGALWLELSLCHDRAHDKFTFFALQLDLISMEVVVQMVSIVFYLGFQSP